MSMGLLVKRKNARLEYKKKAYLVAAKVAVKYGSIKYKRDPTITEKMIREFWPEDDYPSPYYFKSINLSELKWYIHNKIQWAHRIWNADFLYGLATNGELVFHGYRFPTLTWDNKHLTKVIEASPFGGVFKKEEKAWERVPAFYLRHSSDSYSYMAGVLGGGEKRGKYRKPKHAVYRGKAIKQLQEFGIPFEMVEDEAWTSPIWPTLLTPYMPKVLQEYWANIDKPYKGNLYATVLWRTYVDTNFKKNGLPYLKSRRQTFYDYKCDEGAIAKLRRMRFEEGLTELDQRIVDIIKMWATRKS